MIADELCNLFVSQLNDLYTLEWLTLVEKERLLQISKDRATHTTLEMGMEDARECKERIEQILICLGAKRSATPSPCFKRMIRKALREPEKYKDEEVQDTALVAMFQRIIKFEIAIYGSAIDLAKRLSLQEAVSQLRQSVQDKCSLESDLNRLAVGDFTWSILDWKSRESYMVPQPV